MKAAHLWATFRKLRIFVFALSAVFSITWTVFLSIFLSHEWPEYSIAQRSIFLGLVSAGGISAIVLYLMIVIQFRPWLDGARVAFLLLIQLGSAGLFSFNASNFPCKLFGTSSTCSSAVVIIIVGSWCQSVLLALYFGFLCMMSFVPRPVVPNGSESDRKTFKSLPSNGNHQYNTSVSTVDSSTGLLRSETPATKYPSRSLSPNSQSPLRSIHARPPRQLAPPQLDYRTMATGYQSPLRSGTPNSIQSGYSSSSASSFYGPYSITYSPAVSGGRLSPLSPASSPQRLPPRPLPNPFADPIIRTPSSASTQSYSSASTESHSYGYGERNMLMPTYSPYLPAVPAMQLPPPPYAHNISQEQMQQAERLRAIPSTLLPDLYAREESRAFISVPDSPFVVRSPVRTNVPSRAQAATPGAHSIHSSAGSLHSSEYGGSRSAPPLPQPFYNTSPLSSPASALLPLPPGMGSYGSTYAHPGIQRSFTEGGNDALRYQGGYYPAPQVPRKQTPNVPIDGHLDLQLWQMDVLGAAGQGPRGER